ncbi:hypothetical protein [Caenimonas koreensis]|uniref:Uncharacterized protein n=1 Tax=Caenimonas koreensis DSM 17982 TaxID=1121255 RepID=A0A844B692_9BURK|nr:hypothetical protein [Caenimonas koreensis]MRD46061.1 hypothetical protein [Caenimonas koreensis DSM 17982]
MSGVTVREPGTARKPKPTIPFISSLTHNALGQPKSWTWGTGDTAARSFGIDLSTKLSAWGARSPRRRMSCWPDRRQKDRHPEGGNMGPIDPATGEFVRQEISRALDSLVKSVQMEIQDEVEFLLLRIERDSMGSESETKQIIEIAVSILAKLIRPRQGDYAWMVNVERRGALLDSEVGGRAG